MCPHLATINELILAMTEEDLAIFAEGRALAAADSSRLEGLVLDLNQLKQKFLEIYRQARTKHD